MKWMKLLLFISIVIFSCQKPKRDMELIVSKTEVKKGEMITGKVINAPAGSDTKWLLYPVPVEEYNYVVGGHLSKVFFTRGVYKEYNLQAYVYLQGDSIADFKLSKTIHVIDDYFTFPDNLPAQSVQTMNGDQLRMRPLFMPDGSLSFSLRTLNSYNCYTSYIVPEEVTISNGNIKATFNKVWSPENCEPIARPASGCLYTKHVYQDGTYSINITFNNQLYQGSLVVSENGKRYVYKSPAGATVKLEPSGPTRYTEDTVNGPITTSILD